MSTPADRLRRARIAAGFATATAAAESLGVNRDTYTQHENSTRQYDTDAAEHYARRFKTTPEWLLFARGPRSVEDPSIPIMGFVGANPDGAVLFATGQASYDTVPPPPNGSLTARALEVRGHSMPFFAEDGALIYFDDQHTQVPPEWISHIVVLELDTDEVLVKRILRGSEPGLFDLESLGAPVRRDARLRWIARIVAIVPPLEARRLIHRAGAVA